MPGRFISLHTWIAYGPSAVNLDGDHLPKTALLGGVTRQRISSQSLRRARRLLLNEKGFEGTVRTRLLRARLARELLVRGRDLEEASDVARAGLEAIGLGFDKDAPGKTQYALFVSETEIVRAADALHRSEVWDALLAAAQSPPPEEEDDDDAPDGPATGKRRTKKQATKKAKRSAADTQVARDALLPVFESELTPALALWGRMVADKPDLDCMGAVQDAHSVGVTELMIDDDDWTAYDDLAADFAEEDDRGSATLGTAHFATSLMYGQTTIDRRLLRANLRGDETFTRQVLEAYLGAVVEAVPGGRQNTMASRPVPSLVLAVCGDSQPVSLIGHCYKPVGPWEANGDLLAATIARVDNYVVWLTDTYGSQGAMIAAGANLERAGLRREPMADLTAQVLAE